MSRRNELRPEAAVRRNRLEPPSPEEQLTQDEEHCAVAEQLGRPADGLALFRMKPHLPVNPLIVMRGAIVAEDEAFLTTVSVR
ncbi:hypothetical protein [Sphingopyxis flava]|uniref:hypothetical protein n=1 Tax=Sphingopyxis flava TaxID=1507287 RepID=UPI001FE477A8|nr:hypothetical protein [Sphingopyxis flava]